MKAVLINDTVKKDRALHRIPHVGCQLVVDTYYEQCKRVGISIIRTFDRHERFIIPPKVDLVIVNGEGSLHHGRFPEMIKLAEHYPCVLLNTTWQDNPSYPSLKKFKMITVRESLSYKSMPKELNVQIVPDIVFLSAIRHFIKGNPKRDIGITDNVINKQDKTGISMYQTLRDYLAEISNYSRLCIGRFHSVVISSLLEIPFSTWDSNTHKIKGMLTDMGISYYHFDTKEKALANVPTVFDKKIEKYVKQAQVKIENTFNKLCQL